MVALCWACASSIPGVPGLDLPRDPLGACWECGVFGCDAHADKDADSGKWLCIETVAVALGRSAGLEDEEEPVPSLRFASVDEFHRRLPGMERLARSAREEHMVDVGRAGELAFRSGAHDPELLAEALVLAAVLLRGPELLGVTQVEEAGARPVVRGALGQLAADLLYGGELP
jgi:hypothetical protein